MVEGAPWQQVLADIKAGIGDGRWPVGSDLPSYAALARQHHVSVHTVRRAIRELRDAGVLRGQSGVSVKVVREPGSEPAPGQPLAERVGQLEGELSELRDRLDAHLRRHSGDLP